MKKCLMVVVAVAFCAVAGVLNAAELTWIGVASDDWNTAANWSGGTGAAPTASDSVIINKEGAVITLTSSSEAGAVAVNASVTFTGKTGTRVIKNVTIADGKTLTAELTAGYFAHVKGGTLVVRNAGSPEFFGIQNATLSDKTKCAVEDSVIVIESGICTLYSGDGDCICKDPTFIIGENARLENYGWFTVNGTMTIENETDKKIFSNYSGSKLDEDTKGNCKATLSGNPAIVKRGAGALTIRSNFASDFNSDIKVQEGKLLFGGVGTYTVAGVISGAGGVGVDGEASTGTITFSGNNTFTGGFYVQSGKAKTSGKTAIPISGHIYVAKGATLDMGSDCQDKKYVIHTAGTVNYSAAGKSSSSTQFSSIILDGDSTFTGNAVGVLASGHDATTIQLGEHTLFINKAATTTTFFFDHCTASGTGTIWVEKGVFQVGIASKGPSTITDGTLRIDDDAKLYLANTLAVKNFFPASGALYSGTGVLTVTGLLGLGGGENIPTNLTLADTVTIRFPEGWEPETPLPLCSGTLTLPAGWADATRTEQTFLIGDTEYPGELTFDATGKTVSYKIVSDKPLEIDAGTARDLSAFPVLVDKTAHFTLTETLAEDGVMDLTGVPAKALFTVKRVNGETIPENSVKVENIADGVVRLGFTPTVDGEAAVWAEYAFDGNLAGVGAGAFPMKFGAASETGFDAETDLDQMFVDGTEGKRAVRLATDPAGAPTYPANWTGAFYGIAPAVPTAVFVSFGTQTAGALSLIAGATPGELQLVRTKGNSAYVTLATMVVAGATETPHLYVLVRTATTVRLFVDGQLKAAFTDRDGIAVGNGLQLGAVCGGVGKTGMTQFCYKLYDDKDVTNADLLKPQVDDLRIYDCALGPKARAELCAEFPYVSANPTATRTLATNGDWVSTAAWQQDEQDVEAPAAMANVTFAVAADATLTVNTNADVSLETLAFSGAAKLTVVPGAGGRVSAGTTLIDADVTLKPGAVDLTRGSVTLGENGKLTFDYTEYSFASVALPLRIVLTGVTARNDASVALRAPSLPHRTVALAYDEDLCAYVLTAAADREPCELTWLGDATVGPETVVKDPNGDDSVLLFAEDTLVVDAEDVAEIKMTFRPLPKVRIAGGTLKLTGIATTETSAQTIQIDEGGVFDVNGKGDMMQKIVLNGGTLANYGGTIGTGHYLQYPNVSLLADSFVYAESEFGSVNKDFSSRDYSLNGHTLTKSGPGLYDLAYPTFAGGGRLVSAEGNLKVDGDYLVVPNNMKVEIVAKKDATFTIATKYPVAKKNANSKLTAKIDGKLVIGKSSKELKLELDGLSGSGTITFGHTNSALTVTAPISTADGALTYEVPVANAVADNPLQFEVGESLLAGGTRVTLAYVNGNTPEATLTALKNAEVLVNGVADRRFKVIRRDNRIYTSRDGMMIYVK